MMRCQVVEIEDSNPENGKVGANTQVRNATNGKELKGVKRSVRTEAAEDQILTSMKKKLS